MLVQAFDVVFEVIVAAELRIEGVVIDYVVSVLTVSASLENR